MCDFALSLFGMVVLHIAFHRGVTVSDQVGHVELAQDHPQAFLQTIKLHRVGACAHIALHNDVIIVCCCCFFLMEML